MNLLINNWISKKGTKVLILVRSESINPYTGSPTYYWNSTIQASCIINEIGGLVEPWNIIGKELDADLQLIFKPSVIINSGDKIILPNETEYNVEQVINSGPINPDFIEVLVTQIK